VETRAEAVAAVTAHAFDHAILDPAGDTAAVDELIRNLRALRPQLQILLFSPQRRSAAAQASLRRTGVVHLQKPADADDLLRALGLKSRAH
jgi:ActR/RegA family two-component response regulator